jgi:hypothetical protein
MATCSLHPSGWIPMGLQRDVFAANLSENLAPDLVLT